jgi:hypothetical protein
MHSWVCGIPDFFLLFLPFSFSRVHSSFTDFRQMRLLGVNAPDLMGGRDKVEKHVRVRHLGRIYPSLQYIYIS